MRLPRLLIIGFFAAAAACSSGSGPGDGGTSGTTASSATGSSTGASTGKPATNSTGKATAGTGTRGTGSATGTSSTGGTGGCGARGAACALDGGGSGVCCTQGCLGDRSDPANCGGCGLACPAQASCVDGACVVPDAGPDAGPASCLDGGCVAGRTCCGSFCVDTSSDPANCGQCAAPCPDIESCVAGSCSTPGSIGPVGCSDDLGVTCPAGSNCVFSDPPGPPNTCYPTSCRSLPDGVKCFATYTVAGSCCGGVCKNTATDSDNCSSCGAACPAGDFCNQSQCGPTPVCDAANDAGVCSIDRQTQGACCVDDGGLASCIDLTTDPNNCGACGYACPAGLLCQSSNCYVATCTGSGGSPTCLVTSAPQDIGSCCGTLCADLSADPANCGGCSQVCDSGVCAEGSCAVATCTGRGEFCSLPSGGFGRCCGTQCLSFTDLLTDTAHCGNYCAACPGDSSYSCQDGQCVATSCASAQTNSTCLRADGGVGVCCGGGCADPSDLKSDPQNCGACGIACPTGAICHNGYCDSPDSGSYVSCPGSPCPSGLSCFNGCPLPVFCGIPGFCAVSSCAQSPDGTPCANGGLLGICCAHGCIDPSGNADNCGACGTSCPAQTACIYSNCEPFAGCASSSLDVACSTGTQMGACCGASCLDVSGDPQSCGDCGVICPVGAVCVSGGCMSPDGGSDWCFEQSAVCPAGTACTFLTCASESCSGDPDGYPCATVTGGAGLCCGQTCIDPSSNPSNCGACGMSCGPNACEQGKCL